MFVGSGSSYTINQVQYSDSGQYLLEVHTDQNCVDTSYLNLSVELCDIIVVETFSPNGDNINDLFVIDNLAAYPNTLIKIFNRWGTLVYESNDYQNDWDGTSNNNLNIGGDQLPESTYFYIIQLGGDEKNLYKGSIYLKR